ncbi:hypothetical protein ACA910_016993 [Epithemia clementina (nom. ined.)]
MNASTLSLAPMMEYTDRHFRHMLRLLSSETLLYTEMVAANTLYYERVESIKAYQEQHPDATELEATSNYDDSFLQRIVRQSGIHAPPAEGPSVLQLGGSNPDLMFKAVETLMEMTDRGYCDYTALNLNTGCPSPKVAGKGCFGAALMDSPEIVAQLVKAMHDGCQGQLPVTVKCRIGTDTNEKFYKNSYAQIDEKEEYARLCHFIETVASSGVVTDFTIHARIAVLSRSFSPADNRKIPPLKYKYVRQLVNDYPDLTFSLNGGIENLAQVQEELEACPGLKGCMVGRSLAADPWSFAMADRLLFNKTPNQDKGTQLNNRLEVLKAFGKHADEEEARDDPAKVRRFLLKAIAPLFAGERNSKQFRVALDKFAVSARKGMNIEGQPPISELIVQCAMDHLSEEVLLRSREESYERTLAMIEHDWKKHITVSSSRSLAVEEWQEQRKIECDGSYERMLATGDGDEHNDDLTVESPNQEIASL